MDWETSDSEILCGYFGPQSGSTPSDACQKPCFSSVTLRPSFNECYFVEVTEATY